MNRAEPPEHGANGAAPATLDRLLDGLYRALKERHHPAGGLAKSSRWLRRGLRAATLAYTAGLTVLLAALEWYGERNWLLAFLLYVPPQAWLLPLGVLTPLALVMDRKQGWLHLFCLLLVVVGYMDFEWSWRPRPKGPVLTVVTNNIGQSNKQSLTPFVQAEQPDLILLQEATLRGRQFARSWPGYHVAEHGEFVLLSKHPIRSSNYVPLLAEKSGAVAARFEVAWQGQTLVVYNVHLPTPRRELYKLRGRGLLIALAGLGRETGYAGQFRKSIAEPWTARLEVARKLADRLRQESGLCLVAGDFNMPNHGSVYHLFAAPWADAFEKRGRGYGFTFPGYSMNPLTFFGPWLRLDYVFAGADLRPVYCRAEPDRRSQHRAVAAKLEWTAGGKRE